MQDSKLSRLSIYIQKLFLSCMIAGCLMGSLVFAQATPLKDFNVIPVAKDKNWKADVDHLGKPTPGGDFWMQYNQYGSEYDARGKDGGDLGSSFSSGIFTWNTILLFVIRIAKWIANVALVAGAACVIYAGYIYAGAVFTGDQTSKANDAIKYAAMGIIVITCAYGFMRIVIGAFL